MDYYSKVAPETGNIFEEPLGAEASESGIGKVNIVEQHQRNLDNDNYQWKN